MQLLAYFSRVIYSENSINQLSICLQYSTNSVNALILQYVFPMAAGGPTVESRATLSLSIQYWTSRGWAYADVNYGGSAGMLQPFLSSSSLSLSLMRACTHIFIYLLT
jgi:hypothetical protein